jgi:predicted transcriptional regulator
LKNHQLAPLSTELNRLALQRLEFVMRKHHLTRAMTADLLGVSRVLVTRWFKNERRCNDRYPDKLKMIMEIMAARLIDEELQMKRQRLTKRRRETPSYNRKA